MEVIETFALPPDSAGSARAFSRIGYSLEEALADLVDNSIDAGASRVHIVFHRSQFALERVTIADNGCGMATNRLRDAMQFAGNAHHKATDLGVFGIGMKSASLSQCSSMSVLSIASDGVLSACRWTAESIAEDWQCEVLSQNVTWPHFEEAFIGTTKPVTGTVILWERLGKLRTAPSEDAVAAYVTNMQSEVSVYLGLIFHTFLRENRLTITLAVRDVKTTSCFPRTVSALDPFHYSGSGAAGYPKIYEARLADGSDLELEAHVWPSNSLSREYLLGKKNGQPNQGFYFYRNGRLIQAGGWNGVVRGLENELAQARVLVKLDGLNAPTNVQKSSVELPESLAQSLIKATASDGATFGNYLASARFAATQNSARTSGGGVTKLTLGKGVPYRLREHARKEIKGEFIAEVQFFWQDLADDMLFEVDRLDSHIILNRNYRARVLGGERAGGADAPLLKTILFLLLESELGRLRSSAKSDAWLRKCNSMLLAALREEAN